MTARAFVIVVLLVGLAGPASAEWVDLFNGKNLDGWEVIGDGIWTVMRDGTLVGQRDVKTAVHQSWLYTTRDFGEFDLRLEYWLPRGTNSGVSIRDTSRAQWAVGENWDRKRTPANIAYEIQLLGSPSKSWPSGSVYLFDQGRGGVQIDYDWNTLEIESRNHHIRVRLNGQLVSEHPGDPNRSKVGPIGFQLHDRYTLIKLRNIQIREIPPGS